MPVIRRADNGYARLAGSPAVRFDKTADANTDFNSLIKAGAQWQGDNGSLSLNARHWQEDGNRDKGLQMNVSYYF
jgi:putative surface-exposed virulence protein